MQKQVRNADALREVDLEATDYLFALLGFDHQQYEDAHVEGRDAPLHELATTAVKVCMLVAGEKNKESTGQIFFPFFPDAEQERQRLRAAGGGGEDRPRPPRHLGM